MELFGIAKIFALILATIAALAILVSIDWRWSILSLAIIYLAEFTLVVESWSLTIALVKLVTGLMVGAILGVSLSGFSTKTLLLLEEPYTITSNTNPKVPFSFRLFRLLLAGMVGMVVVSFAPGLVRVVPGISYEQSLGGLLLFGLGLIHLSVSSQTLRVILGLLTLLAGFEIIYSVMETSTLVTGLLAVVNLGISLTGAYLFSINIEGKL